jgi:membrane protease YdiL (CAAX protease family)
MPEVPNFFDHILIFVLGIILPFISGVKSREGFQSMHFTAALRRRFYLANSTLLWMAALIITFYWWAMGRPLPEMGLRLVQVKNLPLTIGLSVTLVVLYVGDILVSLRNESAREETLEEQEASTPFLPESFREFPAYGWMCVTAGVCEELLYRGYMVTYFLPLPFQHPQFPWMALFFPAILFSLAHYYQGWRAVIKIFVLSVLLAGIYLSSGSLIIGMVLHFAIDLVGGILAVKLRKIQ